MDWKPKLAGGELVAAPLEPTTAAARSHVREGRPESHRAVREQRQRAERSRRSKAYFKEWKEFQQRARLREQGPSTL
jgi:hypothetical protein